MATRNAFVYAVFCALAGALWLSAAQAAVKAGTVIAIKGDANVLDTSGASHELKKGDPVGVGETVRTGAGSYVVIDFIDGAKGTVRPDSELKVDKYAYGTGSDGAVISLVKGGLRAITGDIAHKNPESYKVKTNVATLGVRGTEFALRLCETDCSKEAKRYKDATQGLEMDGDFIPAN
ncbi:MAG: FecR domain-containing protein [Arenicellales bacterium]